MVQLDVAETEEGIQAVPVKWVCSHFVINGILHTVEQLYINLYRLLPMQVKSIKLQKNMNLNSSISVYKSLIYMYMYIVTKYAFVS